MYSFFKGNVESIETLKVSLEVNSIGYEINICEKDMKTIHQGDSIKLYTYLHVKEDDMKLYGFLEKKNLELFKKLILVSGVGPKVAQGIIGSLNSEDICIAIATENVSMLKSISGVGPKMAQKIIFELKDKIVKEQLANIDDKKSTKNINDNVLKEAITALQVLGYSQKQINDVIIRLDIEGDDVEAIIRKVLTAMQQ